MCNNVATVKPPKLIKDTLGPAIFVLYNYGGCPLSEVKKCISTMGEWTFGTWKIVLYWEVFSIVSFIQRVLYWRFYCSSMSCYTCIIQTSLIYKLKWKEDRGNSPSNGSTSLLELYTMQLKLLDHCHDCSPHYWLEAKILMQHVCRYPINFPRSKNS